MFIEPLFGEAQGLEPAETGQRRVLAVLQYLEDQ
jgi:hypothetical protein